MSISLLTVFLTEAILCTVSGEQLYRKVGEDLVLTPDKFTVPDPITGILWRHGKNKVAELDNTFGLDIYAAFKVRTTLNQTTGELRISGLKKTDSGVYSVEFNSKLLDKTYKLSVIKAVPKPTITSSCNNNKTSCTLTCEGDTTDAEPVTYSWKVGERASEVVDKQMNVSKSDTGKSTNSYKYFCKMNNSAGEGEVSEPVELVFGSDGWLTKARLFGISVFVLAIAGVLSFILGHRAKTGVWIYEKESMPWKGEFWKHQREVGPNTDTSNGVSASTEEALARKNDHKDDSVL
ncbi:T-cell surface antigen CD2-like [Salvelinus alpinus]|uniref:T-cell surface antigen CD2-like n=1 Tax=Salvelinus alpinus TaxID=8036 RepID=UPI0039FCE76E